MREMATAASNQTTDAVLDIARECINNRSSIDLDRQPSISMYVCIHSRFINIKVISSMREVLR